MTIKNVQIPNISCGHCVNTIERELGELEGIQKVKADASSKSVSIEWEEGKTSWDAIQSLLEEIQFPPAI